MHGIKKFAASAALVALSVVGLAACGGESPTPTTALPTATTASVEAPTATTAAVATATTATSADATATTGTGSGGTGSAEALDVLRESASAMRDVKSYHIEYETSSGDQTATIEGDTEGTDKRRFVVKNAQGEAEFIIIGDKAYTRLLGTDQYLETDSSIVGGTPDTNPAGFAQGAQDAEVVGEEQVDGVDTTHIKFNLDLQAAAAASSEVTGQPTPEGLGDLAQADAWIDKDTGFMRKFSYTAKIQGNDTNTTMTLSKFNEPVDPPIEVPTNVVTDPGALFGGTPTTP